MSVTIAQLIQVMEELAPPEGAEEWDNSGLVLEGDVITSYSIHYTKLYE